MPRYANPELTEQRKRIICAELQQPMTIDEMTKKFHLSSHVIRRLVKELMLEKRIAQYPLGEGKQYRYTVTKIDPTKAQIAINTGTSLAPIPHIPAIVFGHRVMAVVDKLLSGVISAHVHNTDAKLNAQPWDIHEPTPEHAREILKDVKYYGEVLASFAQQLLDIPLWWNEKEADLTKVMLANELIGKPTVAGVEEINKQAREWIQQYINDKYVQVTEGDKIRFKPLRPDGK